MTTYFLLRQKETMNIVLKWTMKKTLNLFKSNKKLFQNFEISFFGGKRGSEIKYCKVTKVKKSSKDKINNAKI